MIDFNRKTDENIIGKHIVIRGESISKIAKIYGFGCNWYLIWIYNTEILNSFKKGRDPNLIFPNEIIYIPRSKTGYNKIINKHIGLYHGLISDNTKYLNELQGFKDDYEFWKNLWDFVGDCVKVAFGGYGAMRYGEASDKGKFIILGLTKILGYNLNFDELTVKDQLSIPTKIYKTADVVFRKDGGFIVSCKNFVIAVKELYRNRKEFITAVNKLKNGTLALKGVVEIILAWLKPSYIASLVVYIRLGSNQDTIHNDSVEFVKKQNFRDLRILENKIRNYINERNKIYNLTFEKFFRVDPQGEKYFEYQR